MTVETDRRGRCGLTETLVESDYEAARPPNFIETLILIYAL